MDRTTRSRSSHAIGGALALSMVLENGVQLETVLVPDQVRSCGDVDGDAVDDLCAGTMPSFFPGEVSEALVLLGPVVGPYNAGPFRGSASVGGSARWRMCGATPAD